MRCKVCPTSGVLCVRASFFVGLPRALTLGANTLGILVPIVRAEMGQGGLGGAVVGRHMGKKKALDGVGPLVGAESKAASFGLGCISASSGFILERPIGLASGFVL